MATPHMRQRAPTTRPTTEVIRTYARRMALEAEERLQKRQLMLAEQCASENAPDVRIRAWEKAHVLCLPSDPGHPVLHAIAACTGLTIEQIQDEQLTRRARRTANGQNRGPGELN
jgi:hypothetical protein